MSRNSLHVLVVEDHPDIAELVMLLIRTLGHRVASAGSIAETVEITSREDFDLLLVDYRLPDGTGSELLAQLSPERAAPAVLLTAFDEDALSPAAKEGFARLLRKPVDIKELESVIDSLCGS